ncbi:hypothetical protein DUNSADRAFT_12223 [Dunaliella salina]|uniref:Uncharacterized protein n=1 Tax=Dunaliella salina TaxID=3046 RepID=A0ABQ7GBQ2_DUNSA|nr:hypothetical protein DUNSADRAFT_12223 [Dunaliella salina]|eukprot:KAF5832043.1 hypothetical protein DUNSADRAFT_12223 [Dunaliella salina]
MTLCHAFRVPQCWGRIHDGSIQNHSFVEAKGHRAMSRMLPHLLHDIIDHDFLALVIAWEQLQELSHGERCPKGLTRGVVAELRVAINDLVKLAAKVLGNLTSIKLHSLVHHLCQDILNHGSPYNHDAQGSEHAHKGPKSLYKQTNRQVGGHTYMASMARLHEAGSSSHAVAMGLEERHPSPAEEVASGAREDTYGTAWMQTSQTGVHTLQACGCKICLVCLAGGSREEAHPSVSGSSWAQSDTLLVSQPNKIPSRALVQASLEQAIPSPGGSKRLHLLGNGE